MFQTHTSAPERSGTPGPSRLAGAWIGAALALGCGAAPGDSPSDAELASAHQRIVGGQLDEATSGVVGLALDLGRPRVAGHCSGTLIAPNLVLTARHCVAFTQEGNDEGVVECDTAEFEDPLPAHLVMVSPSPVRPTDADDPSYVRGREIRTLGGDDVCGFDVALVILQNHIPGIHPIEPRLEVAPASREPFSTVGYGLTDPDDPGSDGTRQRLDGSLVRCSREECVTLSDGAIRSSEWASVNAPICSGDSGGPALDQAGRVFGVASRGDLDCEIAVYGDVASFAPFIIDTAVEAARVGNYAPPAWAVEGPAGPAQVIGALQPAPANAAAAQGCSVSATPLPRSTGSWLSALLVSCLAWTRRRRHARPRPLRSARRHAPSSGSASASTRGAGFGRGRPTGI